MEIDDELNEEIAEQLEIESVNEEREIVRSQNENKHQSDEELKSTNQQPILQHGEELEDEGEIEGQDSGLQDTIRNGQTSRPGENLFGKDDDNKQEVSL